MRNAFDIRTEKIMAREEGLEEGRAKGLAEGLAEGKAEGKAEGRAEASREMARKMLADGFDATIVAKYSGLTLDEVEQLQ